MRLNDVFDELRRFYDPRFEFLTFFVTSVCNAKCGHCFYWMNLNAPDEGFPLDDVARLAQSMPPFRTLLISGGEPFLRADLPQVIRLFREHNGIRNASIPSNGILGERTERLTREILRLNPGLSVSVNLSIDGFAETHDRIRGVPKNFAMTTATLERLLRIRAEFPDLVVQLNTVICAANYREVVSWAAHVAEQWDVDGHFFELIRGNPLDKTLQGVPPDELRDVYTRLLPIQHRHLRRRLARRGVHGARAAWRELHAMGQLVFQYRTQYGNYVSGRRWDMPCLAGQTIAVVDYNGNTGVCELRGERVNLRDYNYDWNALWQDQRLQRERQAAPSHECDCSHVCFVQNSFQHNWRARLLLAPLSYGRYRLTGNW